MQQHIKIIDYAISSLLRRKLKSIAVLAAYTTTIAILASVFFVTDALRVETRHILQSAPDLITQRLIAGRHEIIPIEYAEEIEKIPGVLQATSRYWGYYYDALTEANYTLMGIDGNTEALAMLEGRMPTHDFECAIGPGVADIRGAGEAGELILVNSKDTGVLFEVTGAFNAESTVLTNDLVILTETAIIDFFNYPEGYATDLVVTVEAGNKIPAIAAKIEKILPETRTITTGQLIGTYDNIFNRQSGMMLTVLSAAVIALCILAWDKATGISADEKREIGILKAIGWDTTDVLALKLWEGLVISLTSFLAGVILSYIHVFFFDGIVLTAMLKGWSTLFPPLRPAPYFNVFHILVMGILAVVPYVAATVIPTWKTAVTDPDVVMRG